MDDTEQKKLVEERRRKREDRRDKQRRENVGRAQKMHELRVEAQYGGLELGLDAESVLKRNCYIGCSGWFYWHWRGKFYSQNLPTNEWFRCYTRHFNTVELNAPFYSWPTVATVKS